MNNRIYLSSIIFFIIIAIITTRTESKWFAKNKNNESDTGQLEKDIKEAKSDIQENKNNDIEKINGNVTQVNETIYIENSTNIAFNLNNQIANQINGTNNTEMENIDKKSKEWKFKNIFSFKKSPKNKSDEAIGESKNNTEVESKSKIMKFFSWNKNKPEIDSKLDEEVNGTETIADIRNETYPETEEINANNVDTMDASKNQSEGKIPEKYYNTSSEGVKNDTEIEKGLEIESVEQKGNLTVEKKKRYKFRLLSIWFNGPKATNSTGMKKFAQTLYQYTDLGLIDELSHLTGLLLKKVSFEILRLFGKFRIIYRKIYKDSKEELKRFLIFHNNTEQLLKFNENEDNSYVQDINEFSDLVESLLI